MAYSKSDFLSWDDDLDVDNLLGDYTCSDIEFSEKEFEIVTSTKKKQQRTKPSESKKGLLNAVGYNFWHFFAAVAQSIESRRLRVRTLVRLFVIPNHCD